MEELRELLELLAGMLEEQELNELLAGMLLRDEELRTSEEELKELSNSICADKSKTLSSTKSSASHLIAVDVSDDVAFSRRRCHTASLSSSTSWTIGSGAAICLRFGFGVGFGGAAHSSAASGVIFKMGLDLGPTFLYDGGGGGIGKEVGVVSSLLCLYAATSFEEYMKSSRSSLSSHIR